MTRVKTYFAQVSVEVAKQVAEHTQEMSHLHRTCAICGMPVNLEHCKIDERGGPVHDQCYFGKVAKETSAMAPRKERFA